MHFGIVINLLCILSKSFNKLNSCLYWKLRFSKIPKFQLLHELEKQVHVYTCKPYFKQIRDHPCFNKPRQNKKKTNPKQSNKRKLKLHAFERAFNSNKTG